MPTSIAARVSDIRNYTEVSVVAQCLETSPATFCCTRFVAHERRLGNPASSVSDSVDVTSSHSSIFMLSELPPRDVGVLGAYIHNKFAGSTRRVTRTFEEEVCCRFGGVEDDDGLSCDIEVDDIACKQFDTGNQ